jgi:hypothetical protein
VQNPCVSRIKAHANEKRREEREREREREKPGCRKEGAPKPLAQNIHHRLFSPFPQTTLECKQVFFVVGPF